jgi:hypothetical protein
MVSPGPYGTRLAWSKCFWRDFFDFFDHFGRPIAPWPTLPASATRGGYSVLRRDFFDPFDIFDFFDFFDPFERPSAPWPTLPASAGTDAGSVCHGSRT